MMQLALPRRGGPAGISGCTSAAGGAPANARCQLSRPWFAAAPIPSHCQQARGHSPSKSQRLAAATSASTSLGRAPLCWPSPGPSSGQQGLVWPSGRPCEHVARRGAPRHCASRKEGRRSAWLQNLSFPPPRSAHLQALGVFATQHAAQARGQQEEHAVVRGRKGGNHILAGWAPVSMDAQRRA